MDPLTPFERELDAALGIEPSPDFRARVRTRIATEPARGRWGMPRLAFAALALAAIGLAALLLARRPAPSAPGGERAALAHSDRIVWASLPAEAEAIPALPVLPVRRALSGAAVPPPFVLPLREVVIHPGEQAALRRLFEGRVIAPVMPDVSSLIVIPALEIAPILAANSEGDPR